MSLVSSRVSLRCTSAMFARMPSLVISVSVVVGIACGNSSQEPTPPPTPSPQPGMMTPYRTLFPSPSTAVEQPFTGPLGDYFYIATPMDPLPPELSTKPYPPGACDFVPVAQADTPLYFELPREIGGLDIAPTDPPQALKCEDELTSVQQFARTQTPYGPSDIYVTRSNLYHPRAVTGYRLARDRYQLSEVAGKPALVITAPGNPSHVEVILEPFRDGTPGTILSVNADLTGPQAVALAEELLASWGDGS